MSYLNKREAAPTPDLRIVDIGCVLPHEEHDAQRSLPLINILKVATTFTNPPLVAPIDEHYYMVLDGANRCFSFRDLGYQHLLVQVVPYESGHVELGVWQHVISNWDEQQFKDLLYSLANVQIQQGWDHTAVMQLLFHDGTVLAIHGHNETLEERNRTLCTIVNLYKNNARLSRTALSDPTVIWPLYPNAMALAIFPSYTPDDLIYSAQQQAYLPPGVSRHIIDGRALKLHYPLEKLADMSMGLEAKNVHLQEWIREKLANRAVRYYHESTYHFDE